MGIMRTYQRDVFCPQPTEYGARSFIESRSHAPFAQPELRPDALHAGASTLGVTPATKDLYQRSTKVFASNWSMRDEGQ